MIIEDVFLEAETEGYCPLRIVTNRGEVQGRHYRVEDAKCGVIFVGGAGGGWDSPACGLYPRLCKELAGKGVASLRVRFRDPHQLGEATLDVLAG
ncbi:MAG: hypothetical protein JOZ57_02140, partial [Abitibacteriaceae bacterium]|nr:hypothetical protein [Abditibacteriaceae bacterium]